jgi:hypothetical protein
VLVLEDGVLIEAMPGRAAPAEPPGFARAHSRYG